MTDGSLLGFIGRASNKEERASVVASKKTRAVVMRYESNARQWRALEFVLCWPGLGCG